MVRLRIMMVLLVVVYVKIYENNIRQNICRLVEAYVVSKIVIY